MFMVLIDAVHSLHYFVPQTPQQIPSYKNGGHLSVCYSTLLYILENFVIINET